MVEGFEERCWSYFFNKDVLKFLDVVLDIGRYSFGIEAFIVFLRVCFTG